ncbi:hypothetical protein MCOR27_005879 [Pyricularia oryzae]|uniref:Uncharacterized protein n=4 Tax=Pyricularia TaxID=48558 RepID=A0ABQ8P0W0_PYRGI|nr:endoprotease [Pyricularia oryzae 70-15]ELQ35128.1 endoprotease [Pyricularia oryzae Y34]KAH8843960.1 hypothetical protein MCOR01_004738 [Pyricularia oryzae]KAI6304949.1 hypothetical protein MCOR33_000071 [Pyricularia grisea]EHA50296.1 endoprotease [Pyricularia oryzae 70-15]KAH9431443.1 hypothetical protein MCOR02_008732 [Pyricularia oryzae]
MLFLSSLLLLALSGAPAYAVRVGNLLEPPMPPPFAIEDIEDIDPKQLTKRKISSGFFDQYIDHSNPSLGTFRQKFWWSDEFYKGPGSPVILFNPGESRADIYTGYLTNLTVPGMYAQAVGAAVVMLEHRYWGESSPFANLSTKNMQYLTLNNSISDTTRFARQVKLPFDTSGATNAPNAPWVFVGGSYPGALAGWVESVAPGTFWAYHASSAVVQDIGDYWRYFSPINEGMPKNCSADIGRVVEHIDKVLGTGSDSDKSALQTAFGLGSLEHDDFVETLANGPYLWQGIDFSTGYSDFFKFCDYVENVPPKAATRVPPGVDGVGLEKALTGYQDWIKKEYLPTACDSLGYPKGDLGCLSSHNFSAPFYRDQTVLNPGNRQWFWFLCNEPFKFWQNGAPKGEPSIVSRIIGSKYFESQCALWFPDEPREGGGVYTYGIAEGKDVASVNKFTGGWDHTDTKRLLWVNGQFDPWLHATVSSPSRPGGPLQSTDKAPVLVIPGGVHCTDLIIRNGDANEGARKVQSQAREIIKKWVSEFPKSGKSP